MWRIIIIIVSFLILILSPVFILAYIWGGLLVGIALGAIEGFEAGRDVIADILDELRDWR